MFLSCKLQSNTSLGFVWKHDDYLHIHCSHLQNNFQHSKRNCISLCSHVISSIYFFSRQMPQQPSRCLFLIVAQLLNIWRQVSSKYQLHTTMAFLFIVLVAPIVSPLINYFALDNTRAMLISGTERSSHNSTLFFFFGGGGEFQILSFKIYEVFCVW